VRLLACRFSYLFRPSLLASSQRLLAQTNDHKKHGDGGHGDREYVDGGTRPFSNDVSKSKQQLSS
tara:strand:+ start:314 stop:508 length:195 start_codon:yes stop_codon:yes gene_type:complete